MKTQPTDCEFCHGEEWENIDDLPTFDGLQYLEYHYQSTGDSCKGNACRRCVAYAQWGDDGDIVITSLEGGK